MPHRENFKTLSYLSTEFDYKLPPTGNLNIMFMIYFLLSLFKGFNLEPVDKLFGKNKSCESFIIGLRKLGTLS